MQSGARDMHGKAGSPGAAVRLLAAILLFLAAGIFQAGPVRAGDILVTSAVVRANETITRFEARLTKATGFNVYVVENPFRVIIDLRDTGFDLAPSAGTTGKGLITGFRYGRMGGGRSRLVLDVTGPVLIKRSVAIKASSTKPARIIVDLVRTDRETFSAVHRADQIANLVARQQAQDDDGEGLIPRELPPLSARTDTGANDGIASLIKTGKVPLPRPKPRTGAAAKQQPDRAPVVKKSKLVIVIDPGHGGIDPGAIGRDGTKEKDITLAFSKKLKAQLEKSGRYRVVLTRSDDRFLKLRERVSVARALKADLFIAIHADSVKYRRARGATLYTLSDTASDEEAAALAEKENKADIIGGVDLGGSPSEVTGILIELAQRESKNHSVYFARKGVARLKRVIRMTSRPLRSAGFVVLKAPDVPSVLFEMGYLSNKTDARLMSSPKWRTRAATAMARAVDSYFEAQLAFNQ